MSLFGKPIQELSERNKRGSNQLRVIKNLKKKKKTKPNI